MEITSLIIAGIVLLFIGFALGYFIGFINFYKYSKPETKPTIRKVLRCNCKDVNECDIWCVAKENYTKRH